MGKRSSKPGTCQRLSYPFTVNYSRDEIHSCQNHLLLRAFKRFKNIRALELNEDLKEKKWSLEIMQYTCAPTCGFYTAHINKVRSKIRTISDSFLCFCFERCRSVQNDHL